MRLEFLRRRLMKNPLTMNSVSFGLSMGRVLDRWLLPVVWLLSLV